MSEDDNSDGFTLAKQGSITFVGNVLSRLFEFLTVAAVTRLVVPSVYGQFTIALAIVILVQQFTSLSLYRSVDYFLPQYLSTGRLDQARGLLIGVAILTLSTTVIGAFGLVAAADVLGDIFDEPGLRAALPVMALVLPLATARDVLITTFGAIKRLELRALTNDVLRPTTRFLCTVALLVWGFELTGLIGGYIVALFLTVVVGGTYLVRSERWLRRASMERIPVSSLVTYSAPLAFAGVIYAVVGQIDYFVIGRVLDAERVGYYRVAYALSGNLLIVLLSITPIFKPMVSEARATDRDIESLYQLATRWIVMLTAPIAITLAIIPEVYLGLLFTPAYATAGVAVSVLAIGYFLNVSFGPEGMILEGLGHTRLTLFNTVVLVGTNVALDLLLVPHLGIVGAGVGTATALVVAGIAGVIEVYYLYGMFPYSLDVTKVLASGGIALGAGVVFTSLVGAEVVLAIGTPVLVFAVHLGTLSISGGFIEADRQMAERIDARLGIPVVERFTTYR